MGYCPEENDLRFDKRAPKIQKAGGLASQPGCPACDGGWRTVQFSWKLALEEPLGEWGRYPRSLLRTRSLKKGFLYLCPACGQQWYLDDAMQVMSVLPDEKVKLLQEWDSAPLDLTPALFEKAKAIGAIGAHPLSGERDFAEVPCRALTFGNQWVDKCLLSFKTAPPTTSYQKKILFLKDIADIEPSEYALPLEVRAATCRSVETRTGFAPTYIESSKGRRFALNWTVNFFDKKDLKGSEMRLLEEKPGPGRLPTVLEDTDAITFIIADWSEDVRDLIVS